jgi:tetratricopeptide (TPR) repeat protein
LVERLPRRLLFVTGIIASAIALPSNLDAQESAGDSLYRDQRFGAAAQEYLREAAVEPQAPRLWYNAGAAAFAAGNDAQAAAAWVVAHRLAPRSADIANAWRAMVLRSPDLGRAGRAAPLTPTELWVVALLAWFSAWILLAMRRRLPTLLSFTLALLFALAGWGLQVWYQRPLGVVSHLASVRDAPHGLAGEVARVDELMVVRILGERPGWRLVELRNGIRGWAPANAMVETGRLDSDA